MSQMPARILIASLIAVLGVAACGKDGSPGFILLDHAGWTRTDDESLDPYPDHQPTLPPGYLEENCRDQGDAGPAGVHLTTSALEVDTGTCLYFVATQPFRQSVPAGAEIEVEFFHLDLLASGTAHLALAVDQGVLWETNIEMPRGGTKYVETFDVAAPIEAGQSAVVHLHNHGANSWYLKQISVLGD